MIIPASSTREIKTITQIIALLLVIVPGIYRPYVAVDLGMWCMYIAVVITVVSGIDYFTNLIRLHVHSASLSPSY